MTPSYKNWGRLRQTASDWSRIRRCHAPALQADITIVVAAIEAHLDEHDCYVAFVPYVLKFAVSGLIKITSMVYFLATFGVAKFWYAFSIRCPFLSFSLRKQSSTCIKMEADQRPQACVCLESTFRQHGL